MFQFQCGFFRDEFARLIQWRKWINWAISSFRWPPHEGIWSMCSVYVYINPHIKWLLDNSKVGSLCMWIETHQIWKWRITLLYSEFSWTIEFCMKMNKYYRLKKRQKGECVVYIGAILKNYHYFVRKICKILDIHSISIDLQ